jgi:hypothetical protein
MANGKLRNIVIFMSISVISTNETEWERGDALDNLFNLQNYAN